MTARKMVSARSSGCAERTSSGRCQSSLLGHSSRYTAIPSWEQAGQASTSASTVVPQCRHSWSDSERRISRRTRSITRSPRDPLAAVGWTPNRPGDDPSGRSRSGPGRSPDTRSGRRRCAPDRNIPGRHSRRSFVPFPRRIHVRSRRWCVREPWMSRDTPKEVPRTPQGHNKRQFRG